MIDLKKRHLGILQKYNTWGKSQIEREKELEDIFNLIDILYFEDVNEFKSEIKKTPATRLLLDTNQLMAPIVLNHLHELPLVELFISEHDFIVYTTANIYSCRKGNLEIIKYSDVFSVDDDSINNFFYNRPKEIIFFDIALNLLGGNKVPIMIEYGISSRPIIYFLSEVVGGSV